MDENKIYNLKIVHHYYDSGDNVPNYPVKCSIELISTYENGFLEWKKIISNTNYIINEEQTSVKEEPLYDINIIDEIEKLNLKDLKNNYYTNKIPESFSYWEIEYNYNFKIVGTYDNETYEFRKIATLLNFNDVIRSGKV